MKLILVGHSYGCFLALHLAQIFKSVCGLVLLDPVAHDQLYLKSLQARMNDPNSAYKIKHWDQFPIPVVPLSVVVRIHLSHCNHIKDRLDYFLPICKANTHSSLQVHMCSHMIHYDLPWVVIAEVRNLIKLR